MEPPPTPPSWKKPHPTANGTHDHQPHFEFFGPYLGPIGIMIGLPLVCYALVYVCNGDGCLHLYPNTTVPGFPANQRLFTLEATAVFLAWMAFQLTLHLILPGTKFEGVQLPNGKRLTYKLNGELVFWITTAVLLFFGFYTNTLNLSWAYDNYVPLLTASVAFSTLLSIYLYATSFAQGAVLAAGGSTGVPLYDFFIGRELNPRIGSLDLKEFCELYPGLIGWLALNLAMIHKQYYTNVGGTAGSIGAVSPALLLVTAFQGLYVWDALHHEPAILTTMDITTDGFGFMLAFGDLTWVPFTYTLQPRILTTHSPVLPPWAILGLIALNGVGYATFRGANSQKDLFRREPNHPKVATLRTLPTKRGTRLIVSGWWGIARHINYFGDWVMGWAWCLPAGFGSVIPFFYVMYFGALLVHRDRRDDAACRIKYGKDWDRYCKLVRYRIVPFIY